MDRQKERTDRQTDGHQAEYDIISKYKTILKALRLTNTLAYFDEATMTKILFVASKNFFSFSAFSLVAKQRLESTQKIKICSQVPYHLCYHSSWST
jgi:hypothetical protein